MKALVEKNDMSAQCLNCHTFAGGAENAHNLARLPREGVMETQCTSCHTEHKGFAFDMQRMSDAQCSTCHETKFSTFTEGHPEFPGNFPHANRTAINFDHAAHLLQRFKDPRFAKQAPQSCSTCHDVAAGETQRVSSMGFEKNCAACHSAEIGQRDLVVFRLPELEKSMLEPQAVAEACGEQAPVATPAATEFSSISADEPAAVSAFLLSVDSGDMGSYAGPVENLILAMAAEGTGPLGRLIDERAGTPMAQRLLAGLNPEVVKQAACAWARNQEYELPADAKMAGWYADLLELKYKPLGHADPVAKGWIDFAVEQSAKAGDAAKQSRAEVMRDELLSRSEGVGRCVKCHAVSEFTSPEGLPARKMEWKDVSPNPWPFTVFAHAPHLGLLGGGEACTTCHVLDPEAKYADSFKTPDARNFASNFNGIKKETCMQCHGARAVEQEKGRVREDCLLCHVYHRSPGLTRSMLAKKG
jgi:hypothetical protein